MARKRGSTHTTLTETAAEVVKILSREPGIKMIAPGIIDSRRSGPRHVTAVYTTAGIELIISGQGVQKVAIHLITGGNPHQLVKTLQNHKSLKHFEWNERDKKPGN